MIVLVGLMVSLVFIFQRNVYESYYTLITITFSILYTGIIWIVTRYVIIRVHHYYPIEQRVFMHVFVQVLFIICFTLLISWFSFYLYSMAYPIEKGELFQSFFITLIITLLITSIYEGVYLYKQWKNHIIKSERLQKDTLEAKYESLKHQINPHFLFNSLNTLLSISDDNPVAKQFIHDLSDLLRYILDSGKNEVVSLKTEIDIVRKYVNLQISRFPESLKVEIMIEEKFLNYSVAPLSLQMLVENAIKHNTKTSHKPLIISIFIDNDYLVIENNLQQNMIQSSTGIGLNNIKQRYLFLSSKEVIIGQSNDKFSVSLPLLKIE